MYKKHSSFPYNPNISRVFYKSGYVESWAQGLRTVKRYVEELRNKGIIERVGSKKDGYWKLNKK